ncbi:tyrosine/serine/threonine protein phosphatase pps1 [Saxophila tyrrhenica]|uniref:Tyrosine/serine/threonine protein phosphatase pps1 n=1 Tax=Saxophila tyrrhenica TaxID=1690608 RepID=A0AAV9NZ17_9PEZI|nr:tyrosine/serine/threonine protein phosphatase pps1 [Saxophila tyrrhenica]
MATAVCTTLAATTVPSRTATPPPHLSINTSQRGTPAAVPNKHIPFCSPGPRPGSRHEPATPSPLSPVKPASLLYPPNGFRKPFNDSPVYSITAAQLEQALNHLSSQPLPSARQVFPWMHGLHAENQLQLAFFIARKKSLRRTPKCIRGLTVVKAGGDLSHSKIKGAVGPEELLKACQCIKKESCKECDFLDIDPKDGFGVRNFQIQACKMATVSDVVVYGDDRTPAREVARVARQIARAQATWQRRMEGPGVEDRLFNTFLVEDDYTVIEADHPNIIALDSEGCMTNKVVDFFHWERVEMCTMSAPTEICPNVWLGPTPDPNVSFAADGECLFKDLSFDIQIEANDLAQVPDPRSLQAMEGFLSRKDNGELADHDLPMLEFPGSGAILPPTWSQTEVDGLMSTLEWIHRQATGQPSSEKKQRRDSKLSLTPPGRDSDGDSFMHATDSEKHPGRKILIHCADGYTESSLLALAYFMYAHCVPCHTAWLELHRDKGRNFFAYSSDVALLRAIQPRILQASPRHSGDLKQLCPTTPDWIERMDGSLPSRIMPYMYLGNLGHANNPALLKELGIGQILSVGEPVSWSKQVIDAWPEENLLFVDRVQDNGVDPLMEEFGRCLEFIGSLPHPSVLYRLLTHEYPENGRKKGTATLVHCRVGVSRSATICIAEVMNELNLSFPRAYCFVRARRLNVIIQPHLRFCYELLKWEEFQCQKRGRPVRRELEWASIAREIAAMNKPYSRQN